MADFAQLPADLPVPDDDGAARHLVGMSLPAIPLMSTSGHTVDLAQLSGLAVIYAYPKTGVPGVESPDGWDDMPGARGCTPQACGFRDHYSLLRDLGVSDVYGLSAQGSEYQQEAVARLHLPFEMLSDSAFELANALNLPTFELNGTRYHCRLTLVVEGSEIVHTFYPVFPPDTHAAAVQAWVASERGRH